MSDGFATRVGAATAVATLLAGLLGYAQGQVSDAAGGAAGQARTLSVQAISEAARRTEAANGQFTRFRFSQEQRRRAADARRRELLSPPERLDARLERARWLRVATTTERRTIAFARAAGIAPLAVGSPDGPVRDPSFPTGYFARAQRETTRLTALRDGANELADERQSQAGEVELALAVLAVGVFLLGFSLTPQAAANRRLLAGSGGAFVVAGVVFAVVSLLDVPRAPPERVAAAYADATVAIAAGRDAEAVPLLDRVLAGRPRFARAWLLRSAARSGASAALGGEGLPTPEANRAALADARRARALGLRDPALSNDLAFALALEGLRARDRGLLREAVGEARRALREDPDGVFAGGTLGFALLALGDVRAAERAYRDHARTIVFRDPGRRVLRDDPGQEQLLLGLDLQDLALLTGDRDPRIAAAARRLRTTLVAYVVGAGEPPPLSPRPVSELEARVDGAYAGIRFVPPERLDPGRDRLDVAWYRDEPSGAGATFLRAVSGPVGLLDVDADGGLLTRQSFLTSSAETACLPRRRYRVELYVNGRLAAEAATTGGDDRLRGVASSRRTGGVGLGLCVPPGWRASRLNEPGLAAAWRAPGGARGALLLRLPGAGRSSAGAAAALAARAVRGFASELPRAFGPEAVARPRPGFDRLPLFELSARAVQDLPYAGGRVRLVSGLDGAGTLLAGAVWGPAAAFRSGEADRVLRTISLVR